MPVSPRTLPVVYRYRLGSRLEIAPSLNLSLEGERREATCDAEADHRIMLGGQWRF